MKKYLTAIAAASLVSVLALGTSSAAQADVSDGGGGGYGSWQLSGQSPAYTGSVELGGGFPLTTFTASSQVASVQTGASTYLPRYSAPGAVFGSSQGWGYINQRPLQDTPTGSGVTTYTFATPTPSSAWGFVLGDIDADKAVVTAQDANGAPVPVADLGFQGVFNYCMPTTPSSQRSCNGDSTGGIPQFDLPTWDPATATLLGSGFGTNTDTAGASGWFMPRVPLSSLTITYTRLTGLPVYQTWFGTVAHDISGTVSGCNVAGVAVELKDGAGKRVASTTTDSLGNYSFINYLALDSYTVTATATAGCAWTGDPDQLVDISQGNVTGVNFQQDVAPTPTATPSVSPSPDPTDEPTDEPTEEPTGTPTKSQTPGPSPATTPATTPATRPSQGSTTPAAGLATTGVAGATPALLVAGALLAGGLALAGASRRRHKH